MSGKLGTRETYSVMYGQMRQTETQADAWRWLQSNYPEFVTRIPGQRPRSTPRMAAQLCTPAAIGELDALFAEYGDLAPGYERALAEARESIQLCIALEAERGDEVRRYFAGLVPSETDPDSSN